MDAVALGAFPVASLLWLSRPSTWALTVVCKATYRLLPTQAELAAEQEPPLAQDEHLDGRPSRSLRAASDLAPLKPRGDVVLVGHAFAPGGKPVRSFVARLLVGDVDKSIEVFCNRTFHQDGSLHEGPRITRVPLCYERAAGGPDTWNPAGMRLDAPDAYGRIAVPNLQPPDRIVSAPSDFIPPIGFGPIAPRWPSRLAKLGRSGASWSLADLAERPLPDDLDHAYFNVVPDDQQVDALRDDERVILENLLPDHPRLVMSLPGLRPRAILTGRDGGPRSVAMRADTLAIDTDRAICTLVWRGQIQLKHAQEGGRVLVAVEEPGQVLTPADIERMARGTAGVPSAAGETPRRAPKAFEQTSPLVEPPPNEAVLPFTTPPKPAPSHAAAPPPAAAPAPPPVVFAPLQASPPPAVSPWAAGVAGSAAEGLLAASNAAAGAFSEEKPSPPEPLAAATDAAPGPARAVARSGALMLLWVDRASVPRIARKPAWQRILDDLEEEPIDPEDDPALSTDPAAIQDRAQVHAILDRGAAIDAEAVRGALEAAFQKRGRFAPPIALVDGELEPLFDELETLKAMVSAAAPIAAGDEALKTAIASAREYLGLPDLVSAPAVAGGLSARIREAFAHGKRSLPADHLDVQVERALLERRCYQKRKIFGGPHLRALLHPFPPGEGSPMVAYLPAAAADELPMYPRFPARMLAELHVTVDVQEARPEALRVVALGRVVRL